MPAGDLTGEIRRLEEMVSRSISITEVLSARVQAISENLIVIEQQRLSDKENADRTARQMEKLADAINALNETFAEANGKAQGISMTAKAFWAVAGSVVLASIFWLSGTIVELKSTVSVLQSKLEK